MRSHLVMRFWFDEPFDFEHYPHSADYILQLRERMAEIFIQEEQKY